MTITYDPQTETLKAWLERTKKIAAENPRQRAKIAKERARILRQIP